MSSVLHPVLTEFRISWRHSTLLTQKISELLSVTNTQLSSVTHTQLLSVTHTHYTTLISHTSQAYASQIQWLKRGTTRIYKLSMYYITMYIISMYNYYRFHFIFFPKCYFLF